MTPLASIFGSGFLIIVPLLERCVGQGLAGDPRGRRSAPVAWFVAQSRSATYIVAMSSSRGRKAGRSTPGIAANQTAERLGPLPRFLRRLSSPRVGSFSLPSWEPDPDFDIATHMRHASLPAPGGEAELLEWLGDFYSHRLDRARPLWETTFLEGLADGRWALATKVHHCLVDGISGASVTSALLDAEPDPAPGSKGLAAALAPPGADEEAERERDCRSSSAR